MELVKFQFHSSSGTELEKSGISVPDMKKNGTVANSSNFLPGVELTEKFQLLCNFPTYAGYPS